MKQIILITDGCSNVGLDPVIAAAQAKEEGIVVHVIGVIDQGDIGELGAAEIAEIAKAGGGLSRIVTSDQLSQTVQMLTRKTVSATIQQAVNKELQQMMGSSKLEDLPPEQRAPVVRVIEDLSEKIDLCVALLADASASMKPKLPAVQDTVRDLMASLRSRSGISKISVFHFPGNNGKEAELDLNWTGDLAKVPQLFYKINMKGTTPTGPALMRVIGHFTDDPDRAALVEKDGMRSVGLA